MGSSSSLNAKVPRPQPKSDATLVLELPWLFFRCQGMLANLFPLANEGRGPAHGPLLYPFLFVLMLGWTQLLSKWLWGLLWERPVQGWEVQSHSPRTKVQDLLLSPIKEDLLTQLTQRSKVELRWSVAPHSRHSKGPLTSPELIATMTLVASMWA